eukprot:scaffold63484_cov47-Attheya_sp.AAC.2
MRLTNRSNGKDRCFQWNVIILYLATVVMVVDSYNRKPCTFAMRAQFQFPDCFVPAMNSDDLLLSEASFVLSHNAATGYIQRASATSYGASLTRAYSKNQVGTAYDQLNNGARALDLRPRLLSNGTVMFQHDSINIFVAFETLISDVARWCTDNANDEELVLLLPSHFAYQTSDYNDDGGEGGNSMVSAMSRIYQKYGINYLHCSEIYGLTVAEAMELAALPTGGYLLALDGQDYYGTFCGKDNWVEESLITCRNAYSSINCAAPNVKDDTKEPFASLKEYVLASANNEATDSTSILGPPADLETYPFNEIQALWQVDATSAAAGVSRLSSILNDNTESRVNERMVGLIYSSSFKAISLFAVDNVAVNGNALLSVLRNTCGQSTLEDACGQDLNMPKMTHFRISKQMWLFLIASFMGAWAMFVICRKEDKRMMLTFLTRTFEHAKASVLNFNKTESGDPKSSNSRKENLI